MPQYVRSGAKFSAPLFSGTRQLRQQLRRSFKKVEVVELLDILQKYVHRSATMLMLLLHSIYAAKDIDVKVKNAAAFHEGFQSPFISCQQTSQ